MRAVVACTMMAAVVAASGCSVDSFASAEDSGHDGCRGGMSWTRADSAEGSHAVIRGPVVGARHVREASGEPTFLNIGADYPSPSRVTVVIWGQDRGDFSRPPEKLFSGRTICVSGLVRDYKGASEVFVSDPSQITVIR